MNKLKEMTLEELNINKGDLLIDNKNIYLIVDADGPYVQGVCVGDDPDKCITKNKEYIDKKNVLSKELGYKPLSTDIKEKDDYKALIEECMSLREAKNADYNDSFESTLDLFGVSVGFGIIRNKLWRAIHVIKKGDQTVKDDAFSDEIRDVANYLLLLGAYVRGKEKQGKSINFYE